MFTGIVELTARVRWMRQLDSGTQLVIETSRPFTTLERGDSVAINGCCLTVTGIKDTQISFDVLNETLNRTNLKQLRPESSVNIERPLRATSRLDGHFVQGHVDCTGEVVGWERLKDDQRLEVKFPAEYSRYIAYKGSIAVNGISLTVAEVLDGRFVAWVIPHTRRVTNLRGLAVGDLVNLEFDILAKYVERMLRETPAAAGQPDQSHGNPTEKDKASEAGEQAKEPLQGELPAKAEAATKASERIPGGAKGERPEPAAAGTGSETPKTNEARNDAPGTEAGGKA